MFDLRRAGAGLAGGALAALAGAGALALALLQPGERALRARPPCCMRPPRPRPPGRGNRPPPQPPQPWKHSRRRSPPHSPRPRPRPKRPPRLRPRRSRPPPRSRPAPPDLEGAGRHPAAHLRPGRRRRLCHAGRGQHPQFDRTQRRRARRRGRRPIAVCGRARQRRTPGAHPAHARHRMLPALGGACVRPRLFRAHRGQKPKHVRGRRAHGAGPQRGGRQHPARHNAARFPQLYRKLRPQRPDRPRLLRKIPPASRSFWMCTATRSKRTARASSRSAR